MTAKQAINVDQARTYPGVSQAVRAGGQLHLSGQVAMNERGEIVGRGDPAAQAEQCFRNIGELLAVAGATAADVVKLNCYLVDASHYGAYAAAKRDFLGDTAVPPAGTAVIVSRLMNADLLMEVEAVAVLD